MTAEKGSDASENLHQAICWPDGMGLGRAVVIGTLAMIPGVVLALFGWLLSGAPAEWSVGLNLACYGPFFGCIIAGFVIGLKSDDSEMEG